MFKNLYTVLKRRRVDLRKSKVRLGSKHNSGVLYFSLFSCRQGVETIKPQIHSRALGHDRKCGVSLNLYPENPFI